MSLLTKFLAIYNKSGIRGSYRLTDFLSQRLESLQRVPISTESGTLYADLRISSARSILACPKSQSGEDLVMRNFVSAKDFVYDIGAHLGFYTLLLSQIVGENGRVFAFEPNLELLPSLKSTIAAHANIELFTIALSDQDGQIDLFVPEDASMASLSDWTNGIAGDVHRVSCEMHRVDDLVAKGKIEPPTFIKCDVEGAELSVFKGAVKNLDRVDAPVILFEVNKIAAQSFGTDVQSYFSFLQSLEKPAYTFFEVTAAGIKVLESQEIKYANVVAVPRLKLALCSNILI